ncbi:PmoA family protein [Isoptericola haloaureus]|uniref:PmoA family protein n=1 Tax=Isoptericola haloaureus TaxID=1542902 RepID=A0ABU7Z9P5_9MICO
MAVTLNSDGAAMTGSRDGVDLFTYVYRPHDVPYESPRPYLHPLRTRGGDVVSAYRPWDHVWHKGIAWSLPHVGPWNFWGGPNYVREQGTYVDLDNDGSMEHQQFTALGPCGFTEELSWRTPPSADGTPGEVVVREERTVQVVVPDDAPDAWVLTFRSVMTNVSAGPLDIGSPTTNGRENAGYGGLFWRGPRSFTEGQVLVPTDDGGAAAADAEDVRGLRAEWLGFVGRHDGEAPSAAGGSRSSTVVMVDPGSNPGGTPQWFVRSVPFACVCPAPFFSQEVPFAAGQTLTFDYAVVVADGAADGARGSALAALGRHVLAGEGAGLETGHVTPAGAR